MNENEIAERIQKALARGDGERLNSKELGVISDFMQSAKDAFLMADATDNPKDRTRGRALAEKALDMLEAEQPARSPRGQPPTQSIGGSGHVSIKDAVEHWVQLAERGIPPTRKDWKLLGFDRE